MGTVLTDKKDELVSEVDSRVEEQKKNAKSWVEEQKSWVEEQKEKLPEMLEEQKLNAKGELLRQIEKYVPGPVNMRMHFATKKSGTGIECMPNDDRRYVRCWIPAETWCLNCEAAHLTDVSADKMTWNDAKEYCKKEGGALPWVAQALGTKDIWTLKRCQR